MVVAASPKSRGRYKERVRTVYIQEQCMRSTVCWDAINAVHDPHGITKATLCTQLLDVIAALLTCLALALYSVAATRPWQESNLHLHHPQQTAG